MLEEKIVELYKSGSIPGLAHPYHPREPSTWQKAYEHFQKLVAKP